jgi:cell division protein FtsQ
MLLSLAVALLLLLAYPIAKLVASKLVISDVEIIGTTLYTADELLDASGLEMGDGLPLFDKSGVEEMTALTLPYIESCKVNVEFPNKLIYEINEAEAVVYTSVAGEYYALSESLRVLERSDTEETFSGLVYVELPSTLSAVVGENLILDENVSTEYITEFLSLLGESKLEGRVNRIFLEEKFNIVFTVDGRFKVKFGSPKQHTLKFEIVSKLIEENQGKTEYATIDVTIPQKSGIKYESRLNLENRE